MDQLENRQPEGITCPFCSLLCDDLGSESIANPGELHCPRARSGFEAVARETADQCQSRIDGRAVEAQAAIDAAAALLRKCERPLFAGCSGDVAAVRAVLNLAEACGGLVDHLHGAAMMRNLRIFQSNGWMSANFGELRQRADLVVVLDSAVFERQPRFVERFIAGDEDLHANHPRPPELISIGGTAPALSVSASHIDLELEQLADLLGLLRCLLHDRPVPASGVGSLTAEALHALVQRMRAARYGVLVWSAESFDFEHGDLTVQAAAELVGELNRHTRFTCLPLAPGRGAASLQQVGSWKCGFPVRIGFTSGMPDYDPYHHATARVLERGEADLLVWVSSFDSDHPPPASDLPTVVLGRPAEPARDTASVFVPVGVPAIDHTGYMFRGDGSTAVPGTRVRDIGLPSAAAVLQSIHERWSQEASG